MSYVRHRSLGRRLAACCLASAAALMAAPQALAQGCAMCKVAAEASGNPRAMNLAILVLLVPTVGIFVGILVRARRIR